VQKHGCSKRSYKITLRFSLFVIEQLLLKECGMVEVQIHDLISTSDVESDQLRTSTTDKGAPDIVWIGSCVRSLAVLNAVWRRAWPDTHCGTVTIQLLFTVRVCVCDHECAHTGPRVQDTIRSRTSALNTGKEYFSVIGTWTVSVCAFW
jgi:hypothetical protein